jgi:gluconate 2-dehydrogenase gamma chain
MTDDPTTTIDERRFSRRRLLGRAGAVATSIGIGGALAACGADETPRPISGDVNASQLPPLPPRRTSAGRGVTSFFTHDEAVTVEAIVGRLIPGDAADPGAREADVPTYIDTKLSQFEAFATPTYLHPPFAAPVKRPTGPQPNARGKIKVQADELPRYGFQGSKTPQDAYRAGLAALDAYTMREDGKRFAQLDEARQDAVLEVVESGKAAGFKDSKGFFDMVLEDTYEGMFADPVYGGNKDYIGWKLVGYPGAQRAWTPPELKHGPRGRRVQGLREMPAMYPGIPQGNAILPISGLCRIDPNQEVVR